jgi:hypothetical protein
MNEIKSITTTNSDPNKIKYEKLAKASYTMEGEVNNPWFITDTPETVDMKEFQEQVEACRFFYRHDPIISTAINKMVEIGVNEIRMIKNGLSENEFRVFTALKDKLHEFAQLMALEFLISGLVIPEISYDVVDKLTLNEYGIKKYTSGLVLPISMWLRDPETVKINKPIIGSDPSYFVKVPDKMVYFIMNNGKYQDGTEDRELFNTLLERYPEFIRLVKKGEKLVPLKNKLIIRRLPLSDTPYPTLFIFPAVESLKHKRNLRRMDYSIAARAIGAIQLFNLGSDEFPITEDNQEEFSDIKQQMYYREGRGVEDIERIFQLFANHTLKISWVYPPLDALLNERKYAEVNSDIIFGLGFPRILITGETEKSGTSSAEYAMKSPAASIEMFRRKIITVLQSIVRNVAEKNSFKTEPIVKFKPLNLMDFNTLLTALRDLYNSGNLSRTEYSEELGFDWNDSQDSREEENKVLKDKGLEDINPKPFSNNGQVPGGNQNNTQNKPENQPKQTKTTKKE